eukprot:Hpha_TRINITY_DN15711_c1_g5::TRINITY_DN15711_c1_g5_i5::g.39123::m.39123/K08955/YME1; ATP-dependent metalloprotease
MRKLLLLRRCPLGLRRRLPLRRYSELPPPPQPYHHYHHQYPPQYPGHPQHAPHPLRQPGDRGTWDRPLVVEVRARGNQFFWDILKIGFWSMVVVAIVSVTLETPSWTGDDDKPSDEGAEKKTESSHSPSSMGLMGNILKSETVKPVDLSNVESDVQWKDVHGCDEAKEELKEVVAFLKDPERFTKLGGKLPKGFLLVGPPGTGKTMLAKAVAREAGVPFFYASGAQFDETFVGVGAKRVRELFSAARQHAPCIIFIDEIDAVGAKRSKFDTSHDRATINQLLAEMDGFNSSESVIVLAATNAPRSLDKALTRPGRFDREVSVDPPDMRGRVQILDHYLGKVTGGSQLDARVIARGTNGMVGADLANVVNLATLQAAKEGADKVEQRHLEEAKDRVSMGMEQKSKRIPEDERKMTAYHEAGHALVAMFTEKSPPLHKATIRPRGQALGLTMQLPHDDQISHSYQEMQSRLRVLMGGRIAEEMIFGRDAVTSGASNDIQQATSLARMMVRKYGLSAKMGCVDYSFADDPEGVYLSNRTRQRLEEEVRNILELAYTDATRIMTEQRPALESIAQGLIEKDTLTGAEMMAMAGVNPPAEESR